MSLEEFKISINEVKYIEVKYIEVKYFEVKTYFKVIWPLVVKFTYTEPYLMLDFT